MCDVTLSLCLQKLRKKVQAEESREHGRSMTLMKDVGQVRLQNLLHFYSKDLQVPMETAKTTIRYGPGRYGDRIWTRRVVWG